MATCQQTKRILPLRVMEALLWLCAAVAPLTGYAAAETPIVQLDLGVLHGTRYKLEGRTYHAYRGVPYAETPAPFEVATMKKPWLGVLEATSDGPSCLQHDPFVAGGEYSGSADCLYLNVYTPAVNGEQGLPIIVYIHGGGYSSGHAGSQWVNPQYFMLKDVIVVTVAYRLGVFGFLCTGDDQAAANVGLRDQALALRWVREHAAAFGGAPDRVTLMGQDAGAACVHLHMVAPSSRGLFSRAISQSGVWLSWWLGAQPARQAAATAMALASLAGCEWDNSLRRCLAARPPRALLNASAQFQFWSIEPLTLFRPCVDTATESPFLPVEPLEALEQGRVADVPWLLGVTSGQGVFRLADIFSTRSDEARTQLGKDFDEIMPLVLGLNVSFPFYKVKQAWLQIKLLYYGSSKVDPLVDDGRILSNLYADRLFLHGWKKTIIYHHRFARADNIYAYVFNYSGSRSFQSYYGHGEFKRGRADRLSSQGVCHGDDLLQLFEMPKLFPPASGTDREAIHAMVSLWTNFAKHGYPVANRERPSNESTCWRAGEPDSAWASWPAASESEPWFAELRGGGQLWVCPRLQLPGVDARLRHWDALPMAENIDLSLARDKMATSTRTIHEPHYGGDDYYEVLRRTSTAPQLQLRPLLCLLPLLVVLHIRL